MNSGDDRRSPEETRTKFVESGLLATQHLLAVSGLWFEYVLLATCICLLTGMFLSVFTGVVIRYVVTVPFPWTEEVARFCLIWFGLLAASIGARRGLHFSFQWGLIYIPDRLRYTVRQVGNCAVIVFLAMLLWQSFALVDVMTGQTAVASGIDMRVPAYGIVTGVAVLLIMHIFEVLDALLSIGTGQRLSVREQVEEAKLRTLRPSTAAQSPTETQ